MKVVVARRFSNALVAHRASEVIAIYPITPSFTMASLQRVVSGQAREP